MSCQLILLLLLILHSITFLILAFILLFLSSCC
jgi:hypothetical protein